MVSTLSAIGFRIDSEVEFEAAMGKLATGPASAAGASPYAVWKSPTGASLWFHLDHATRRIVGLNPFFEGKSRIPVRITSLVHSSNYGPFEGAAYCWVAPDDDAGLFPLVFEAADYLILARRALPLLVDVRFSLFAHQLQAFSSPEDFDAQQDGEFHFADQSFVPIGIFPPSSAAEASDEPPPPSPTAMLCGRVRAHSLVTNEVTGNHFHVLEVATLADMVFDVVADPKSVEGTIAKNGVVQVTGHVFGRVLD